MRRDQFGEVVHGCRDVPDRVRCPRLQQRLGLRLGDGGGLFGGCQQAAKAGGDAQGGGADRLRQAGILCRLPDGGQMPPGDDGGGNGATRLETLCWEWREAAAHAQQLLVLHMLPHQHMRGRAVPGQPLDGIAHGMQEHARFGQRIGWYQNAEDQRATAAPNT